MLEGTENAVSPVHNVKEWIKALGGALNANLVIEVDKTVDPAVLQRMWEKSRAKTGTRIGEKDLIIIDYQSHEHLFRNAETERGENTGIRKWLKW
jgi:hypothetical protein